MKIPKCPFCNKQASFYLKKYKIFPFTHISGVNPFYRCRKCNIVVLKDKLNKHIVGIYLFDSQFFIRLHFALNITILKKMSSPNIFSTKKLITSVANSTQIIEMPGILNVTPQNVKQKIKTILLFS